MPRDIPKFLNNAKEKSKSADVAESFRQMEEFYDRKLWHQLTVLLLDKINDANFVAECNLQELYEQFIAEFEHRINPVSMAHLAIPIAASYKDAKDATTFLEKMHENVKTNVEAGILIQTGIADALLNERDPSTMKVLQIERVGTIVKETKQKLDTLPTVTPTHGAYHKVSANYMREIGDFTGYYKEALRYLGCIDIETLTETQRKEQAFCLALAALLAKDVYNFGELLVHPILTCLEPKYLGDLLFAFNSGNIEQFEKLRSSWQTQEYLRNNADFLLAKIQLLCLMEMAFVRPSKGRQIKFGEIASTCRVPASNVERLVMKALSLGLLRGSIDQVSENVTFDWVQPRVLDRNQIGQMAERVAAWGIDVSSMQRLAELEAEEILSH